jgi:hypothetical protein
MSWWSIVILTAAVVSIPFILLATWLMDRFDELDRDRP